MKFKRGIFDEKDEDDTPDSAELIRGKFLFSMNNL